MEMEIKMEINVLDASGKVQGTASVPEKIQAAGKPNAHMLHEVVQSYLANQRKGTHKTLTRSMVSGSSKKPWKQKHTGRARAGTSTSPLWRGGGIIHGPQPRSYRVDLPQAKVQGALLQSLFDKFSQGQVVVSSKPVLEKAKTKAVAQWIKNFGVDGSLLFVLDKKDDHFSLASRNIQKFSWVEARNLHAYDVLKAQKIIFTPEALQSLQG